MSRALKKIPFLLLVFLLTLSSYAQEERKAISFQGILKEGENLLIDQEVYFRLALYSDTTTTPLWEELQVTLSNEFALFTLYLGGGEVTGNALTDVYSEVPWSDPMWMRIEYKLNENDNFEWMGTRKFQALPFAMHVEFSSGEDVGLNDLFDVENTEQVDFVFKWNGDKWISSVDANYAWNSFNADSSVYSDTALFAINMLTPIPNDSVDFAFFSDSVHFGNYSNNTTYSTYSVYVDTSGFSFNTINAWDLNGNIDENQIGTLDSTDFVIKSNTTESIRITAAGEVLVNAANNQKADVQIKGPVALTGFHQDFSIDTTYVNAFYWEPKKSSLIIGNEMTVYFVDTLGRYSFAGGRKGLANSYSFAWGDSCLAIGNNVVSIGVNCSSTEIGLTKFATGISFGKNAIASKRSIAIGYDISVLNGSSTFAIGNDIQIDGGVGSIAMGFSISNTAKWSYMLGNGISTNVNSILFADNSTNSLLTTSIVNQFKVRADGGTKIFSDSLMTTGVVLNSGSGSWALLSDINSKENILKYNWPNNDEKIETYLKVKEWNYQSQRSEIRHIGVMSQDFNSVFSLKENSRQISMIDMDGITLSGIAYLLHSMEENEKKINIVEEQLEDNISSQELIFILLDVLEEKNKGGQQ
jgi:hypothetical protein